MRVRVRLRAAAGERAHLAEVVELRGALLGHRLPGGRLVVEVGLEGRLHLLCHQLIPVDCAEERVLLDLIDPPLTAAEPLRGVSCEEGLRFN